MQWIMITKENKKKVEDESIKKEEEESRNTRDRRGVKNESK